MGNRYFKDRSLSLAVQLSALRQLFPNAKSELRNNVLTWIYDFVPSPMSQIYKIKLTYKAKSRPVINIIEPKQVVPEGKKLPHVFPGNKLCLYRSKYNEWDSNKLIVYTIVPWISEWLLHYEIWLITGKWCGGGEHPDGGKEKEE